MMNESIKNFSKQFSWQPKIENQANLDHRQKVIVCGMGGSHLAADILKDARPGLQISIHSSYGLPAWSQEELEKCLIVLSSYSGNTEEVLSAYDEAIKKNLSVVVLTIGGQLLSQAKKDGVAYIQMPDTGIQPRLALGYSFIALAKILGDNELLNSAKQLGDTIQSDGLEKTGKDLAEVLKGYVPIVYVSHRNYSVGYNWKIKLNETGKIPAFCNVLPELNHNEMNGFDVQDSVVGLSEKFYFVFIKDNEDSDRVSLRFEVLQKLYKNRNLPVHILNMKGNSRLEKIFSSLILADWVAFYTALNYGLEPEQVPMVEEFKKLIKK